MNHTKLAQKYEGLVFVEHPFIIRHPKKACYNVPSRASNRKGPGLIQKLKSLYSGKTRRCKASIDRLRHPVDMIFCLGVEIYTSSEVAMATSIEYKGMVMASKAKSRSIFTDFCSGESCFRIFPGNMN